MSEMIDFYLEQVPRKCQTCPVIGQFAVWAERYEATAQAASNYLDMRAVQGLPPDEKSAEIAKILDQRTTDEIIALGQLSNLVELNFERCPGFRRGLPWKHGSRINKTMAVLSGRKVCQNPNFCDYQASNKIFERALTDNWDRIY